MLDAPKAFSKDTDEQIAKWIRDALERPSNFSMWSQAPHADEMFATWSLGPVIEHRDSDVLQRSNAAALRKHLASDPTLASDYDLTECNHWAVGHVTHLSFRVIESDGTPSRIARIMREWSDMLAEYPVADESLFSEMESESAEEYWRSWQERDVRREVAKELASYADDAIDPDAIEEQIDALDPEVFWELAVHRDGNGREISSDGSYVIRNHEIEEIAQAIRERGLVTLK